MRRPFASKRPLGPFAQMGGSGTELRQRGADEPRREPLVLVREIQDEVQGGDERGRVSEREIGSVKWEDRAAGISFTLSFHESAIDRDFTFKPSSGQPFDNQGSSPAELGGKAGELGELMAGAFDVDWEFAELDAASIGGMGQLTDYEFTYEGIASRSDVVNGDIDAALHRM